LLLPYFQVSEIPLNTFIPRERERKRGGRRGRDGVKFLDD